MLLSGGEGVSDSRDILLAHRATICSPLEEGESIDLGTRGHLQRISLALDGASPNGLLDLTRVQEDVHRGARHAIQPIVVIGTLLLHVVDRFDLATDQDLTHRTILDVGT